MSLLKNYSRMGGEGGAAGTGGGGASKGSITIGVVGYPNAGKSSLINSLKRSLSSPFARSRNDAETRATLGEPRASLPESSALDLALRAATCLALALVFFQGWVAILRWHSGGQEGAAGLAMGVAVAAIPTVIAASALATLALGVEPILTPALCILLVILHTKYTGWRDNDFNVHA